MEESRVVHRSLRRFLPLKATIILTILTNITTIITITTSTIISIVIACVLQLLAASRT